MCPGRVLRYGTCGVKDISKKLVDLDKHTATKLDSAKVTRNWAVHGRKVNSQHVLYKVSVA